MDGSGVERNGLVFFQAFTKEWTGKDRSGTDRKGGDRIGREGKGLAIFHASTVNGIGLDRMG